MIFKTAEADNGRMFRNVRIVSEDGRGRVTVAWDWPSLSSGVNFAACIISDSDGLLDLKRLNDSNAIFYLSRDVYGQDNSWSFELKTPSARCYVFPAVITAAETLIYSQLENRTEKIFRPVFIEYTIEYTVVKIRFWFFFKLTSKWKQARIRILNQPALASIPGDALSYTFGDNVRYPVDLHNWKPELKPVVIMPANRALTLERNRCYPYINLYKTP